MTARQLIAALREQDGDMIVIQADGSQINEVTEKYGAVMLSSGSKLSKSEEHADHVRATEYELRGVIR